MDAIAQPIVTMDKKEVAEFCKVSIATINRWMKEGILSFIKIERRVLFLQSQVIEDLKQFQNSSKKQA